MLNCLPNHLAELNSEGNSLSFLFTKIIHPEFSMNGEVEVM